MTTSHVLVVPLHEANRHGRNRPSGPANKLNAPWIRGVARIAVKTLHTVIFIALAGSVLETVRAGLHGSMSRLTRPAIAATFVDGAVLALNHNRCPLTTIAEDLGAEHGEVSDIFLPRWFARHIPTIFTKLFGFGLGRLLQSASRNTG